MNITKTQFFLTLAFVLVSAVSFLAVPSISRASTNVTCWRHQFFLRQLFGHNDLEACDFYFN
jgi:hypothetical protein